MVAELAVPLARLVRRALETPPKNLEQLHYHAGAYERSAPEMEVKPGELLPVLITGVVFLLIIASIDYTIGTVMATLAMIESPSGIAIVEPKPPKYSEEPEFADEKETAKLMDADVEVTFITNKPITAKFSSTMARLRQVGGFCSQWRGLSWSILYSIAHSLITLFLTTILGFSWISGIIVNIAASTLLARLRMSWTHSMIAQPATAPSDRQTFEKRHSGLALLKPTVVNTLAQQATILVPLAVYSLLGMVGTTVASNAKTGHGCGGIVVGAQVLQAFAAVFAGLLVAWAVLLPSAITLTRVEAALLPAEEETIVPFDHEAILGDADISTSQGRKQLFVQTWKSVDRSVRFRLVKLYAKMVLVELTLLIVGLHVMFAEVLLLGRERIETLVKSAHAQIRIAMIENQAGAPAAQ